ncbi:MAG: hypothetical protein QNJ46_29615 [Leptolyngbyaceae cyanobacterium MO_188.B28]|nr:hypothetical protein [Leptolyngbyaceae cyanobacterium MO_188.B28]
MGGWVDGWMGRWVDESCLQGFGLEAAGFGDCRLVWTLLNDLSV